MKRFCSWLIIITLFCASLTCAALADESKIPLFVNHVYRAILGREADESGLNSWTEHLTSGNKSASDIIQYFFDCDEFKSKSLDNEQLIDVVYKAMLDRAPDSEGKAGYVEKLNAGTSLSVIINGISASDEFRAYCASFGIDVSGNSSKDNGSGSSVPSGDADIDKITAFVTRCYQYILGRDPDPTGLEGWVGQLAGKRKNAAEIIDAFMGSPEFISYNVPNDQMVEILYNTMLDRASDPEGKRHWLNTLYAGNTYKNVINGFCAAPEFVNLCAIYGIPPVLLTPPVA